MHSAPLPGSRPDASASADASGGPAGTTAASAASAASASARVTWQFSGTPYRPDPAWTPSPVHRPTPRQMPFSVKELGAVLGVSLVCDLALWGGAGLASGGFGMALFFVALPIALAVAARAWRKSGRLYAIAALLALVGGRCFYGPTTGTVLCGLALLAMFAFSLRARRMFVPEALVSTLSGVAKLPSRVGAAVAGASRIAARTRVGRLSYAPIVIPVALCGVFAGVFALANPIVAHGLEAGWRAVSSIVGVPSPVRIFLWVAAVAFACSLLRPACRLAQGSEHADDDRAASPAGLSVARNALGALNVLFLLYNGLDTACLWRSNGLPAGMDTQQYAHQGAFWLTIALVLLTGVIGVMFRGPLAHDARARSSRILAFVWMAQGLVLGLGTYRRIGVHIANSGLSDLRIVGILGTTLVVAGMVLVALKLHRRLTFTWLLRRQLDALAVTLVLYSVFPTHLVSAHVNVARIQSGEYRPMLHTFRQASRVESAGELVPLLGHADVRVRQGVAALLEQEQRVLADDIAGQRTWRERDVASRRTLSALDAATPQIATVLGDTDRSAARQVLLNVSRAANDGSSLEELLAIPDAASFVRDGETRRHGPY